MWSDEFEGNGLVDSNKWTYEEGMLRNNEAQYYTKANTNNARQKDGMLIIEARKENSGKANYTSASLTTQNKKHFRYGKVEVRAKLPMGRGTWPAIWMLGENIAKVGWPACGEIDIMENVGFDSLKIHGNVHTEAYNHVKKTNKGNNIQVSRPWEEFHIYSIDWSAEKIDFFIDNKLYFTFKKESNAADVWPYNTPHYLILNLAIGGEWGGQKGIDDTKFPHQYFIDYVRVYE
jgi:beta-glucanase (GH16 family)